MTVVLLLAWTAPGQGADSSPSRPSVGPVLSGGGARGAAHAGASLEAGNAWNGRDRASRGDLRYAGSVLVGANTAAGPIYLTLGATDCGRVLT